MPSLTWAYCHAASSFQRCTEMALLLLVSSLFGESPGRLSLLCDSSWLASSGLSSSFPNFPHSWHHSSLVQVCPNHAKKSRNPGPSSSLESDLQMVSIRTLLYFFPARKMPSQWEDWGVITLPPFASRWQWCREDLCWASHAAPQKADLEQNFTPQQKWSEESPDSIS